MEAGEYGLTRGTSFVASRLDVVAVAGLLWISWCVWVRRDFVGGVRFFFFERTRPAASMRPPCLIHLLLVLRFNVYLFLAQCEQVYLFLATAHLYNTCGTLLPDCLLYTSPSPRD